ncbi:AraC family transcriptional regulator [Herbaspirillum sp. RV1423]|uniref:AraC family transcriptional regulator n=1 Tax=Herbaspirillum sp. RV1423 TaxID=1443993 RepID=UPI0004AFE723|nr:AraC family transcriptional regulator [Herbaspirillum sp. RV1423]
MDTPQLLTLRTYGADGPLHHHDHVQIVLPMQGEMEIEVGGRGSRLDLTRAAFVAPDIGHAQSAQGPNRFLILDCKLADIGDDAAERLRIQTFLPIPAAVRRLVEFIDLSRVDGAAGHALPESVIRHCSPLLLAALTASPQRQSRLQPLLLRIEAAPGQAWTAARMARVANLSVSRLHALFKAELGRTPQEWLSDLRVRFVQDALAGSDLPLAELALRAGYSDQSALTRAMRRTTGMTPAAYRRQHR